MSKVKTLSLDSIAQFQSFMCERGKSANTVKAYSTDLRMFLRWAHSDTISHQSLPQLTSAWLNETRKLSSPKTTERRLTSMRSYAKWAKVKMKEPRLLSDYSLPTAAKRKPHPLPEGREGIAAMCSHAKTDDHAALFALQGYLGLRVSEARSLTADSFDMDGMFIRVRGKGDKERDVPVSPQAWGYLRCSVERSRADGSPLVRMPDRTARYAVTHAGRDLGFARKISTHDLRATAATTLFERTKDIRLVQEFLGHESVTTTQLYVGISMDSMREGLDY